VGSVTGARPKTASRSGFAKLGAVSHPALYTLYALLVVIWSSTWVAIHLLRAMRVPLFGYAIVGDPETTAPGVDE